MVTIEIKGKQYKVKEARTSEQKKKGLQGIEQLLEDEGMLFYYDPPEEVSMWMKDVNIPLDIIFFNEDQEAVLVQEGKPNDKTLITAQNVAYVLELNKNSGIEVGDEFEFDGNAPVMKVLAPDGSTQMELWGGERIFRRPFTKQLIRLVKQADSIRDDIEAFDRICKRIGRKMFKEIKKQDTRPPEYVQGPSEIKESE